MIVSVSHAQLPGMSKFTNHFATQKITLSWASAQLWAKFRNEIARDERFIHRSTSSVMIEYLLWHFEQTRGQTNMAQFAPKTRPQGRPRSHFPSSHRKSEQAARPSEVADELKKLGAIDQTLPRRKL